MKKYNWMLSVAITLLATPVSRASEETLGPNGINSLVTGLNGSGVPIGQVEDDRPGVHGYDTAADCCNQHVVPAGVFVQDRTANVNESIHEHALWVASVMISKQIAVDPDTGMSPPIGVAQEADLFSAAFVENILDPDLQEDAAIASQHLASGTWAINMSFGLALDGVQLDGSSLLTQFIDWSTRRHEVLYVVAGARDDQGPPGGPVPTDNYNGITVGVSRKENGVFRIVADYADELDAVGDRTSTDIIAPGILIDVAGANGTQPPRGMSSGSSFAAPHVTGAIALLHQRANIIDSTNARRHETKKAILLNSADKIDGIIGMERTVGRESGGDWFSTIAHSNAAIPLDDEMGAGHLNVNRAVIQLDAGEQPAGGIQLIGWDYNLQDDPFQNYTYTFGQLAEGDYVSITLVWDRIVELNGPFEDFERGDGFIDLGFSNLDVYLIRNSTGQTVASSISTVENLEHIFAEIPANDSYRIEVDLNDPTGESFPVPYALAWWAGADLQEPVGQGDFNSDGNVDAADYVMWRKTNGSSMEYGEWVENFGSSSGSGGAVPEPAGVVMAVVLAACVGVGRGRWCGRIAAAVKVEILEVFSV